MKLSIFAFVLCVLLAGILIPINSVTATDNPDCSAPTGDNWTWTSTSWGGYWHFESDQGISFTVPVHIAFVDYFVNATDETLHRITGETVADANTASAFCTTEPTPTTTPTLAPTATPTVTPTPDIHQLFLPVIVRAMPELPSEALCSWPSQDSSWSWVPQDWGGYWHIGPLNSAITIAIPDHISFVVYSLNGIKQPIAHTGDTVINLTEGSAFCK